MKHIKIEKCPCGNKGCNTYGLNIGTFYQGSGFIEIEFRNGEKKILFFADLINGRMIKDIVARAKLLSIKAEYAGKEGGMCEEYLIEAIKQKRTEQIQCLQDVATPDTWAKINSIKT